MGYTKEVTEKDTSLLPEGWYTAKLLDVTPKEVGKGTKLKWKFEVLEPAEFATKWAWGECWDNLDQSDSCVWRRWHEALVERPMGIGENIDTDDVINYMALIHVTHRSYYKDKIEDAEHLRTIAEISEDPESVRPIGSLVPDEVPF